MVQLKQIKPRIEGESDRNSWNLYKFAKKYGIHKLKFYSDVPYDKIDKAYDIFVCTREEKYSYLDHSESGAEIGIGLWGKRLIHIFCSGYGLTSVNYIDSSEFKYDITEQFWKDYMFYGRCKFLGDMTHKYNEWNEIQEDKISIKKVRICEYCGKKQYLTSWQETVIKTEWVDEE